jgi:hypothetical protein
MVSRVVRRDILPSVQRVAMERAEARWNALFWPSPRCPGPCTTACGRATSASSSEPAPLSHTAASTLKHNTHKSYKPHTHAHTHMCVHTHAQTANALHTCNIIFCILVSKACHYTTRKQLERTSPHASRVVRPQSILQKHSICP